MTSSPLVHLHHNHQYHHQFHPPQHSISFDQCGGELKNVNNKLSSELDSNSVSTSSSSSSTLTTALTSTKFNNQEIKETFTKLNRINGATPKRRLSYTNNNSPLTIINLNSNSTIVTTTMHNRFESNLNEQSKSVSVSSVNSNSSENNPHESPFMLKRPSKENCRFSQRSNTNINNSPYTAYTDSPKHQLNESFEALNNYETIGNGRSNRGPIRSRNSLRRGNLFRYRTDPVASLNSPQLGESTTKNTESMALNDISNQMKQQNNHALFNLNEFNLELMNADYSSNSNGNEDEDREKLASLLNFENPKMDTTTTTTTITKNDQNNQHEQFIKHSLEIDAKCKNLIGDRSCEHILPTITSAKHQDLNCISPETLVDVLNGLYDEKISEYIIIDSRYPYEFEGGHISSALNIFTQEKLGEELFLKRLNLHSNPTNKFTSSISTSCFQYNNNNNEFNNNNLNLNKYNHSILSLNDSGCSSSNNNNNKNGRRIVIFHCEFSSERGPGLLRFLRNLDRQLNEHSYPNLYYPELYLLEGGYKNFYEQFKLYCCPQSYKPMLHVDHSEDLRHFRSRARSDGCKYEMYAKLLGIKRNGSQNNENTQPPPTKIVKRLNLQPSNN